MDMYISNEEPRLLRTVQKMVKETVEDASNIWKRMRVVLEKALLPHPEARTAVLLAIEEEFITRGSG